MKAVIGTKIGMTQIFDSRGKPIPVTMIAVEPNVVTQIKTFEKDGYRAVQVAAGAKRHISRPLAGHLKKSGLSTAKTLREFRLKGGEINLKEGDRIQVSAFQEGDLVEVTAISKGKGFAGVIKRHGFRRAPESHGADHQRQPGSIGSQRPQRVLKGKRMPGRLGGETVTVKNLAVVKVDPEGRLLAVQGAVPGPNKGTVIIRGT